jgi:Icc-related predicted phosphoesterase
VTKLFFATDIHGSDICWSKFLNAGKFYEADVLILGGDMTGKAVVPFIHQGGKNYRVTLLEQVFDISNDSELQDMTKRVRSRGYYPYMTSPDEIAELEKDPERVHQIFAQEVLKVMQQWMDLADKKLDSTDL